MAEYRSNIDKGFYLKLWVDETDVNKADNTSELRVRLFIVSSSNSFAGYDISSYVDIAGQKLNAGNLSSINANSQVTLIDQYITVLHGKDGKQTVGLMAQFNGQGGYSPGILKISSSSFKTTDILRTSSVSVPDLTLGSASTLAIASNDPSYTHTLRYDWYGQTGTIVDKTTSTSYSWTPPISLASGIPNSISGSGKIYIDTYYDTSLLGTSSVSFTASVPDSVVPTLSSVTLSDTNPKVSAILSSPNFLQVLSNIAVNFSGAIGAYGSTIQSYKAEIVGKNQSTNVNGGTLGIMNYFGSYIVRATVTDSRGRTSTAKDTTITVLEYFLPVFYFETTRVGSDSQTIQVKRNAKIAPIMVGGTQKNTMTITFRTSLAGKNTWTTSQTGGGSWAAINTLTDSLDSLSGVFSVSSSYDIEGTISDKFSGDIKFSATVGTKVVVSSKDKDGRYGFGRIADKSLPAGSVDISGVFAINGKQLLDIFYRVGTIYESTKPDNPSTFMGGTWVRFGNGQVLVGVNESDTDFNTVNKTGGEKTHVLTEPELASHSHGQNVSTGSGPGIRRDYQSDGSGAAYPQGISTQNAGGNQAHNNLQPYVTVYRWQRTA
ncbi:hypothetical protein EAJ09_16300 [Bacteroides stercoris]|uniref:DUF859 family phage minor structural protein n=1 Tax=Bacteroides stercoris TaxID=46506 RepID=UPI0010F1F1F9|nr:DUF859 family phage minor structural protein [Bacteroides stercoris]RYT52001.1 hypothetical protein EAJ09_16300 [Bacteroides stercoris]